MKKVVLTMIILTFVFIIYVYSLAYLVTNEVSKEQNKYKEKIGKSFVLGTDTCTIINYSTINETFTLSNGKEVSSALIFNN